MRISKLSTFASSILAVSAYAIPQDAHIDAGANPANWVTYTKNLPQTTVVVTKYLGDEPLTGSQYTTRTFVAKYNGQEVTKVVTGRVDAAVTQAAEVNAAAKDPKNWVTYTKELADKTIVVTRYMGQDELVGDSFTTKTIVANANGQQYTELVTALAQGAEPLATAAVNNEDDDWVTFTKTLEDKTITVTKYKGSEPLTGAQYTTKTIVNSKHGKPAYTRVITAMAEVTDKVQAAAENPKNWVTYTKELADKTIVVTRYMGKESLTGDAFTTKTIVANANGQQYTELVTALANPQETVNAAANPDNWVTYTKELADKTIVVTRYMGKEPLVGDAFTTKTIVANANGQQYTELVTALAQATDAPVQAAAADPANWVTYTKELADKTIVVTRYMGKEPLTGESFTTKTIVANANGQQYTELVTALAQGAAPQATVAAGEDPANWVTYTKYLPDKTIAITKYVGTAPLTGTQYTTRTALVKFNGQEVTKIVTGRVDAQVTEAPVVVENEFQAAENPANWVTYTKDLGDRTIVVTRYLGKVAIHGDTFTTKTIVRMLENGAAQYTELVTAKVDPIQTATESERPEDLQISSPPSLLVQWVHQFMAWI